MYWSEVAATGSGVGPSVNPSSLSGPRYMSNNNNKKNYLPNNMTVIYSVAWIDHIYTSNIN